VNTIVPQADPPPVRLEGRDGFRAPARRVEDLPGPGRWPIVGNTWQLRPNAAHAVLESWAQRYGPLYRLRFGPYRAVGVTEPGLIDQLLRHRPVEVGRSPRISQIIDETGFKGVFTAEGEAWRRQRRLVMRALTPETIRAFFPVIATVTGRLQARWQAAAARAQRPDVMRDLKCYSIDVTTWLTMGLDIDTLTHDANGLQADVETWFHTVGRRLPQVFRYWRWLRLPADRRSDAAIARLHATVDRLIAGARHEMAEQPQLRLRPRNILQALLTARDEHGSEFSDADVRGNVAVMLFAGEDTTANTMAWLLYHLATEPAACAAARAQADTVLGPGGVAAELAQLDQLTRIEAVALESMRLKPIAPVQGMRANVDLDLAGLVVPRGHLMFLLPRVCATQEARFAQAARFLPERWLGEAATAESDGRRSMFPFGGGQRHCPGRFLAMVEIKMVTAMVLGRFDLRLEQSAGGVGEHFGFTMAPGSLPLHFSPRGTASASSLNDG
jgi:cytochrome P450